MHLLSAIQKRDRKPSFWPFVILVALYLAFTTFSSVLTPAFSGPDDDFHLASIWCAKGVDAPNCMHVTPGDYWSIATVPSELVALHRCKPRDISASGHCEWAETTEPTGTIRSNNGSYPKLFYSVNNLFIGSDTHQSIIKMRVFNALLVGILLIIGLALLPRKNKWPVMAATIFTSIPFPLFMLGTNNPQSWSLSLIIPLFNVFNFVVVDSNVKFSNLRKAFAVLYVLIASSLIIGARADGKFVLLFAIGISALQNIQKMDKKRITIIFVSVLSTGLLSKLLGAPTPNFQTSRMESFSPGYLLHNLVEFPGFILGIIGGKGDSGYLSLGEYDLPLPSIVFASILCSWAFLLSERSANKAFARISVIALAGIAFIGMYSMYLQGASTAGYFQPRYLLAFCLILLTYMFTEKFKDISQRKLLIALTSLFIAYIGYIYAVILRYSSGIFVEKSKYLQVYSGPNTYVSKEMIHWRLFSGDLYGLITIDSKLCFVMLSTIWLGILVAVYLSRSYFLQRNQSDFVPQK